jgi:hypothetical protein
MLKQKEVAVKETAQAVDKKTDSTAGQDQAQAKGNGSSYAKIIIELAHELTTTFHTPDGDSYASISGNGKRDNIKVRSRNFKILLRKEFYKHTQKALSRDALKKAINQLDAEGKFDGPEIPVHVRYAEHDGAIYIDLFNENLEQIRITSDGWEVISSENSPVRFIHPRGMQPLPVPERNGSIDQLRGFLNIRSNYDFTLIVSWVLKTIYPLGPHPILVIQGEQGAAKTTTARVLRLLTDPSSVLTQAPPKSERDLMITSRHSWVLNFDNISGITPRMSDAFCRIATGNGFRTRTLRTDDHEELFNASRPCILNGIEEFVSRHDLADRALVINLPDMPETKRKPEDVFWREFEAACPFILGAFYDALSMGLRNLESVTFEKLPRMADFAKFIVAAEPALPWKEGQFMAAYENNRNSTVESALEGDVVAWAVIQLMSERNKPWSGTPTKLNNVLGEYAKQSGWKKSDWPGAPNALSGRLKRVGSFLKKKAIVVENRKSGNRVITITRVKKINNKVDIQLDEIIDEQEKYIPDNDITREVATEAAVLDKQFKREMADEAVEYEEVEI